VGGPGVSRAGAPADSSGYARGPAPASEVAAALGGPATGPLAVLIGSPRGFTLRRVANPAYRPPDPHRAGASPGVGSALRALDWASAQVAGRGAGPASRVLDWALSAGEETRKERAYAVELSGTHQPDRDVLRRLRFDTRQGRFTASLGDVPPQVVGQVASLQRLRGTALELGSRDGSRVRLLGGAPTPVPG